MDLGLDNAEKELQREIIDFARQHLNEGAADRDQKHAFSRSLWEKCGEVRLQGLPVDVELGGRGLSPLSTALALESFGYACPDSGLVFAVSAHLLACVVPVWKHGSDSLKQRYLPALCDGRLVAANGMTEPGSGSDAFSMQTRAVRDGEGYRITGHKTLISNAPVADVAVVYAMTDPSKGFLGGSTAFLIDRDTDGFTVSEPIEKMSLRTTQMGELHLDDVFVSDDNVIGGVGAGATLFSQSMEWERICLVAGHIGKMRWLLEKSVKHARTRTAFGQKIGKFQAVSHRIADMKIRLEAARWLTYSAAWRLDRSRDVAIDSSAAKVFVSESLLQSALDAVRTLGGYGVLVEHEVERTLRDSTASVLYSGTNDLQRDIIARWLGL